jgi:hypothetical protein
MYYFMILCTACAWGSAFMKDGTTGFVSIKISFKEIERNKKVFTV